MTHSDHLRLLHLLRTQLTLLRLQMQNERGTFSCARRTRLEARYSDRRARPVYTTSGPAGSWCTRGGCTHGGRTRGGLRGYPV